MIPRLFLLMVLTCFFVSDANSQEIQSLFSSSRISSNELTGRTLERFEKIISRPEVVLTRIVEVINPVEMLKGRTVALDLTEDIRLIGTTYGFTETSSSSVIWVGNYGSERRLQVLAGESGNISGLFLHDGKGYTIEPLGDSMHIIYQTDMSKLAKVHLIDHRSDLRNQGDPNIYVDELETDPLFSDGNDFSTELQFQKYPFLGLNDGENFPFFTLSATTQITDPPEIDILFL